MYTIQDVQYALLTIIEKLNKQHGGDIRDINGNRVGEFGYR